MIYQLESLRFETFHRFRLTDARLQIGTLASWLEKGEQTLSQCPFVQLLRLAGHKWDALTVLQCRLPMPHPRESNGAPSDVILRSCHDRCLSQSATSCRRSQSAMSLRRTHSSTQALQSQQMSVFFLGPFLQISILRETNQNKLNHDKARFRITPFPSNKETSQ